MFELACTVRNCRKPLQFSEAALRCDSGHHFDYAKAGYWNLLQPQDRRSANPGDSEDAVLARQRWLSRGFGTGLVEALKPWFEQYPGNEHEAIRTLDLGCGEGSFGAQLCEHESDTFCGIDLSKKAIRLAAKNWPAATWVLCNADRFLPAQDASVHRVVSLFGRRPLGEIRRILAPNGVAVVAVPGEEDLIQLRKSVQTEGRRRNRWESIVAEASEVGLELLEHKLWSVDVELEKDAIEDALSMSYRAVRNSERERLRDLTAMTVTLAADNMLFKPKS